MGSFAEMKIKPLILAFNRCYLPGYRSGGPIRTLANMVSRLSDEFDFHIVTRDRDSGDTSPYSGVVTGAWTKVGKAQVMYIEKEKLSIFKLAQLITDLNPNVIYLNSFFDPFFTQRILMARRLRLFPKIPVILAPRGEFSGGALKLKQAKKKLFLAAAKIVGLYDGLMWQASSDLEQDAILNKLDYVKKDCIHVAKNLAPVEDGAIFQHLSCKESAPLRVCFLSRIVPMKNLDFALQTLNSVNASIILNIYGPKELPAYWDNCEQLIARLPKNVSVTYGGTVQPDDVKHTMAQHDLFFLPTRGENYGHVIHEALSAGLPVLISDQTPWNEVTERGVGWALPLDNLSEFARIIDEVASWEPECHAHIRQRAVEFAKEKSVDNEVLQANRALFTKTVSEGRC